MDKVRVGLIGGGFVSSVHAEVFQEVAEATLASVCAVPRTRVEKFVRKWNIPFATNNYHELLERPDVDMVVVGIPNDLHRPVTSR